MKAYNLTAGSHLMRLCYSIAPWKKQKVIDKELKAEQSWVQLIVPFLSCVKYYHVQNEKSRLSLKAKRKGTEKTCLSWFLSKFLIIGFKFLDSLLSMYYLYYENIVINEWPFCLTEQIIFSPSRYTPDMHMGGGGNKWINISQLYDREIQTYICCF